MKIDKFEVLKNLANVEIGGSVIISKISKSSNILKPKYIAHIIFGRKKLSKIEFDYIKILRVVQSAWVTYEVAPCERTEIFFNTSENNSTSIIIDSDMKALVREISLIELIT